MHILDVHINWGVFSYKDSGAKLLLQHIRPILTNRAIKEEVFRGGTKSISESS